MRSIRWLLLALMVVTGACSGHYPLTLEKQPVLTSPMGSTEPQRWARVPLGLAWKHPGLPRDWVRVLERHPYPDGLSEELEQ